MTKNEIEVMARTMRNGRFVRISYRTDVRASKESRDKGISIEKVVEETVRHGVAYNHIARVKEKESVRTEPKKERVNNYSTVIKNVLDFNSNTNNYYYRAYRVANHANKNTKYYLCYGGKKTEISREVAKSYCIPSAFDGKYEPTEIKRIKIENIISIK